MTFDEAAMWKQNRQNGSQEKSKTSGKSKQVEFGVIPLESESDFTECMSPAQVG